MIDPADMQKKTARLRQLMQVKLGVRSKTLSGGLRRAGRRLPRRLRKHGALLVQAEALAANPKLARTVDSRAVASAFRDFDQHLQAIDVADARRGRLLGVLGAISFNFLLVVAGTVVFLWWRGYV